MKLCQRFLISALHCIHNTVFNMILQDHLARIIDRSFSADS